MRVFNDAAYQCYLMFDLMLLRRVALQPELFYNGRSTIHNYYGKKLQNKNHNVKSLVQNLRNL